MMDADYEGVLKDLLDKAEHKNSVPKKASRYTAPKDSSDKPDPEVKDQRWAHKKPNAFRKPHRGNFNGSFESLDSSPTPERQHKFFQHPNAYNKPKDNSYSSNTESVKAFLEKMFQQHSSMVNTKLNTIMQKVNHFSGEIEKLKNANAELQKNNKTLLKLVLEEKSNSGTVDPQIKNKLASKTAANKQKSTTELEQLLEKTTVINSSNATSSKRVTRSSALKIKKDDSSSDEYVDTESIDPSDELKSDIIRLRKKMDLVASKKDLNNVTKKNLATLAKDLNVTKKDLATGAKKKQSLSKVPEVERLMELVGEKIVFTTGTFSCDKCEKGFIDCNEGDGVILQQCVHTFCRQCIGDHILENKEKDIIDCLYPDCDFSVQESEIQELLSLDEYETRLDQQASNIKDNMEGAEQCRLKGCRGFVVVEKGVFDFVCPVCHHTNCLDCKKIHADGLTCRKLADLTTEVVEEDDSTCETLQLRFSNGSTSACDSSIEEHDGILSIDPAIFSSNSEADITCSSLDLDKSPSSKQCDDITSADLAICTESNAERGRRFSAVDVKVSFAKLPAKPVINFHVKPRAKSLAHPPIKLPAKLVVNPPVELCAKSLAHPPAKHPAKLVVNPPVKLRAKSLAHPPAKPRAKFVVNPPVRSCAKSLVHLPAEPPPKHVVNPPVKPRTMLLAHPPAKLPAKHVVNPPVKPRTMLLAYPPAKLPAKHVVNPLAKAPAKRVAHPPANTSAKPLVHPSTKRPAKLLIHPPANLSPLVLPSTKRPAKLMVRLSSPAL